MEKLSSSFESASSIDVTTLATWNRQRSTEELKMFIRRHHLRLLKDTEQKA